MGLTLIVLGCVELFWNLPSHFFTDGWETVQAKIEDQDLFRVRRRRGDSIYHALTTYTYTWNDATYSGQARFYGIIPKTNEALLIVVNPKNPSQSSKIGFNWLGIGAFALFLFGGLALLWTGLIHRDNSWRQLEGKVAQWNGTVNVAVCVLTSLGLIYYLYTTYIEAFT
jgi:hypothetical protein